MPLPHDNDSSQRLSVEAGDAIAFTASLFTLMNRPARIRECRSIVVELPLTHSGGRNIYNPGSSMLQISSDAHS